MSIRKQASNRPLSETTNSALVPTIGAYGTSAVFHRLTPVLPKWHLSNPASAVGESPNHGARCGSGKQNIAAVIIWRL